MKRKTLTLCVINLILPVLCWGQHGSKTSTSAAGPKSSCQNTWRKFDIKNLSICVPDKVQFKPIQGIDQTFRRYQDDDLKIDIFSGARAPVLLQERNLESFKSTFRRVDDVPVEFARYISVEGQSSWFVRTARIISDTKHKDDTVMIYILYRDEADSAIVGTILDSIIIRDNRESVTKN